MKLAAYLSRSRHGVFYFRWPLPNAAESRQTVRISLQTRCPKRASLLARHLASCGESLRLQVVGSSMRYDEIRTYVQAMLQESLQRTIARLDMQGPLYNYNSALEEGTRSLLAAGPEDYWEMVGPEEIERTLEKVTSFSGRPRAEIDAGKSDVLELYRVGLLAYWDAVSQHRTKLQSVELVPENGKDQTSKEEQQGGAGKVSQSGATLSGVIKLFIEDQMRGELWSPRTKMKREATLAILVELFGGATPMLAITKAHAQDAKSVLFKFPQTRTRTR